MEHPALVNFKYCPNCAGKLVGAASEKSIKCCCGFEFFLNPAAASGVFVINDNREILLVRRSCEPAKGKFGVPGGFADAYESLEVAAVRELKEETGIEAAAENLTFLCSQANSYEYNNVKYCSSDAYFIVKVPGKSVAAALSECSMVRWIKPAEIDMADLAFESLRRAMAVLRDKIV